MEGMTQQLQLKVHGGLGIYCLAQLNRCGGLQCVWDSAWLPS